MAETNQLLFNLNVPCNPLNLVTQFYNPGPVVIERLPGTEQPKKSSAPSPDAFQQAPVEFTVVSKEKLAFAMQLARRDMKNKIREQQQQQQEQQVNKRTEGKDNIAKSKKTFKTKGLQKKTGRMLQPASSPQRSGKNVNSNLRSVKTQTPPSSSKHRRHLHPREIEKGSPVLVLQSKPQSYPDFEKRGKEAVTEVKSNYSREMASKTKSSNIQQKEEIARLNKELKTCMERISHLSKQVSESSAVSSPDRTATLRAGLEALMRAERSVSTEGQRSEITWASPRRYRKSVPENKPKKVKQPRARGVLIPSKPKFHFALVPSAENVHFTQPTESSKSKARPPFEVMSQRKTARATKPAWTPPGSPSSFHRVRMGQPTSSPRRDFYSESDGDDDRSPRRRKMSRDAEGERENHDQWPRDGPDRSQMQQRGAVHQRERLHTSLNQRGKRDGTEVDGQGEIDRHHDKPPDHMFPGQNARNWTETSDFFIPSKEAMKPHRPNVRRKVQFDALDGERDTGSLHSDPTIRQNVISETEQRILGEKFRGTGHSLMSKTRGPDGLDHFPQRTGGVQSKDTSVKTKDKITDMLVDEILEDAVREFERVHADDMLTRQAQTMEAAPTFENMLQQLELMEVEEERIRQRWKQVTYDDPGTGGTAQGQRSYSDNHIWVEGTPLDAQQMERLDGIPDQHTAMHFTQRRPADGTRTTSVSILPSAVRSEGKDDDRGSPMPSIVVHSSVHQESHASHTTGHHHREHHEGWKSGGDGRIPIFVGSDALKRICEGRDIFTSHLKKTSHLPFGTFDPWKLVERISDELVDEILGDITGEVGDVISNYVETLYASEFDVKTARSPAKDLAPKTHDTKNQYM